MVGGDFNVTYFASERNSDGHVTLAMGVLQTGFDSII